MSLRDYRIAAVIPAYNEEANIARVLRSLPPWLRHIIVVEDCGPNPALREKIMGEFGNRIEYIRNSRRRGLFDNWNACIESCDTPWLCILHDDDLLKPTFIESMIELSNAAPGRG